MEWNIKVINIPPIAAPAYSPAALAWNSTVTLSANGKDQDNPYSQDTNKYRWAVVSRPPNAVASLVNGDRANATIAFNDERNLGLWVFKLEMDDNEGQIVVNNNAIQFTVPNAEPNFTISGAQQVPVKHPIQLGSSKLTDDDGGDLTFTWDILKSPLRSPVRPRNGYATTPSINIPTTQADVGEWIFRLSAKDNEDAVVAMTVTVLVVDSLPRIAFSGASRVTVGQSLLVETTVLTDDDGGNLSFRWEAVQQPGASGPALPSVLSTTSMVSTGALWVPGTWIVRLTAMDDEENSVQSEFKVLVDAEPYVSVTGFNGEEYEGVQLVTHVGGTFPILYGLAEDPDSTCLGLAHRCHRTDGRTVSLSPGIVSYKWYITDLPLEANSYGPPGVTYYWGPVSDTFNGVTDDAPTLNMMFEYLPEGSWTFDFCATDGEGNQTCASTQVLVQQAPVPPETSILSDLSYVGQVVTTSLEGVLPRELSFTGHATDWDNGFSYYQGHTSPTEQLAPWTGIVSHRWSAIPPSPDCPVPALGTGTTLTLYPAGTVLAPACLGRWRIRFTATDDDTLPLSSTAEYVFTLKNCSSKVCIDTPRSAMPAVLSSGGQGILIGYHVDAALYDELIFGLGVSIRLEVIKIGDALPLYTSTSGNLNQSGRGRMLLAYWPGTTQVGAPVPEGQVFSFRLTLLDAAGNGLESQLEYGAIRSEPMKIVFNEPPTRYLAQHASGSVSFTLSGAQGAVDSFRATIRDSAGRAVKTIYLISSATSVAVSGLSPAGHYTLEIAAVRGGISYTLSTQKLTVYQYQLQLGSQTPQFVVVNNDDDNFNGVMDSEEAQPAGDDELAEIKLVMNPPVPGTLSLEHTLEPDAIRFWTTLSKTQAFAIPSTLALPAESAPPSLFMEALRVGSGELRLQFTTTEGITLPTSTLKVETHKMEIVQDSDDDQVVEEDDATLSFLRAGRWDNAYDGTLNVLNGADPNHFVARDPSRFYLRARGPRFATNASTAETLGFLFNSARGSTQYEGVQVPLVETGSGTSVLVSRSLMMTGFDIEGIPRADTDDGFATHDGVSQVVADNAPGDRTFRSSIHGNVSFQPLLAGFNQKWRMPVCGPSRRKMEMRILVFLEPFQDIGVDPDGNPATNDQFGRLNATFDYVDVNQNGSHDLGEPSEPYVDLSEGATTARTGTHSATLSGRGPITSTTNVFQDVRQTNTLWSPACLEATVPGQVQFVDAPTYNFTNILADGVITNAEFGAIYEKFGDTMTEDIVDVFYGTRIEVHRADGTVVPAGGHAFPPLYQTARVPHGEKLFVLIQSDLPTWPVLAHELAHILTNTADSPGSPAFFYPTVEGHSFTQINSGRRMPLWVETESRMTRAAGDMLGHGNRVLKTY
ncbi:hypothetical protein D7V88_20625 [Corallococcus terminator]|uniref:Uncharacterized protein n=1 Tax=Corallococcus terminator TaxID=2316733 RepID=A0A3A8IZ91_9BACT|nr:hypothetical protein D7V88_20625 [Corallococcus terminator]